ncbi:MAG: hypothetical protein ACJ73C_06040 [Nitrososphaeraceae archaeon]
MVNEGLSIGRKLFEEADKPKCSKIIFEDKDKGLVERESTWTGNIKGYNSFPSGRASGSGRSYIHNTGGITISHWEGVFNTEDKEQLTFKGRDVNKNGKFIVLRTYFTKSEALGWMNGLVCILTGEFDTSIGAFKSTGYELLL